MDDIEELAAVIGEDVEELYRKVRESVMDEVATERALSNMMHDILLLLRANALYCRICLEMIDNPYETARSVERRIGVAHGGCRDALAVARGVSPDLARAVELSRVLSGGIGRERGGACKVNTYTNSD